MSDASVEVEREFPGLRGRLRARVICLSGAWGGLEQVAVQDAAELAGAGIETKLLGLAGTAVEEKARALSVAFEDLGCSPWNALDPRLGAWIAREAREGATIFHAHQPTLLGSLAPWLWARPRVGLVLTRHIESNHRKTSPVHRLLYGRVDALAVMTEALRRNVLETHPLAPERVPVVPLGLDLRRFEPGRADGKALRRAWGVGPEDVLVGIVGRLDPNKGQDLFLEAASRLRGPHARFVVVGEETRHSTERFRERLERQARELGISDRVVFAGFQADVPAVMAALDIGVMASREEAFGLVAIEAMALGKPVIVPTGGSSAEIVGEKEQAGWMFRKGDPTHLAERLESLVNSAADRQRLGRAGRDWVRARYTREARLRSHLALYSRVLGKRHKT